ncbi:hypothetical protein [Bacillus subtilis]|uniref:hypothetical protein n=1 Tax=Bacillus subtilis TaxID=1423 RepID=UPI00147823A9|nr:hypothetical protein [Bacillus subtilis]QJR46589.1 hypothetical protein HIR77_11635 [Bacillus subtilis subsp. subtilis str. 168]
MLKLINLQSGASNYCADTIDSLVGIYIKENQESPADKVNPIKEYFFAKSHETSIHVHNTFNYNPIKKGVSSENLRECIYEKKVRKKLTRLIIQFIHCITKWIDK